MDLTQILPDLYLGSHPRSADDIDTLAQHGITAVLNLQTEGDHRYLDIDWSGLRARYFAQHIEVRRVPILDFNDDDLRDKLAEAVQVLAEVLDAQNTVFCHCSAGMNRSPTVVIAYMAWKLGWDLDAAESHVRKCRRCAPVMSVIPKVR